MVRVNLAARTIIIHARVMVRVTTLPNEMLLILVALATTSVLLNGVAQFRVSISSIPETKFLKI